MTVVSEITISVCDLDGRAAENLKALNPGRTDHFITKIRRVVCMLVLPSGDSECTGNL